MAAATNTDGKASAASTTLDAFAPTCFVQSQSHRQPTPPRMSCGSCYEYGHKFHNSDNGDPQKGTSNLGKPLNPRPRVFVFRSWRFCAVLMDRWGTEYAPGQEDLVVLNRGP